MVKAQRLLQRQVSTAGPAGNPPAGVRRDKRKAAGSSGRRRAGSRPGSSRDRGDAERSEQGRQGIEGRRMRIAIQPSGSAPAGPCWRRPSSVQKSSSQSAQAAPMRRSPTGTHARGGDGGRRGQRLPQRRGGRRHEESAPGWLIAHVCRGTRWRRAGITTRRAGLRSGAPGAAAIRRYPER